MSIDIAKQIEAWFAEHDGDGEFALGSRDSPYSVIGPIALGSRVIYTTKPRIVAAGLGALERSDSAVRDVAMVGRYGLPNADDLSWFATIVGNARLAFLGDMDAVDLLIFAWLRAHVETQRIAYSGIHDRLLAALDISIEDKLTCPCSTSERDSLDLLRQVLPAVQDLVGVECYSVLQGERKIELEALVSTSGNVASVLHAALA